MLIVISIVLFFIEIIVTKRKRCIGLILPILVLIIGQSMFFDAEYAFFRNIGLIDCIVMLIIFFLVLAVSKIRYNKEK